MDAKAKICLILSSNQHFFINKSQNGGFHKLTEEFINKQQKLLINFKTDQPFLIKKLTVGNKNETDEFLKTATFR